MTNRVAESPRAAVQVPGQAMRLRLVRPRLEDGPDLAEGSLRIAFVEEGLSQDEPGRHVVRKPLEPFPAEADRISDATGLAIGVGQGSECQRRRILCPPLLGAGNRAE